jgi:hypothetical protein
MFIPANTPTSPRPVPAAYPADSSASHTHSRKMRCWGSASVASRGL